MFLVCVRIPFLKERLLEDLEILERRMIAPLFALNRRGF